MNVNAFRRFYDYHFTENRKIRDEYVASLSHEQLTQPAGYSHGSVRDQIVHHMSVDKVWFSELRDVEPSEPFPSTTSYDRERLCAHRDNIEKSVRNYLAELRDDMLFNKPIKEPEEDRNLIV